MTEWFASLTEENNTICMLILICIFSFILFYLFIFFMYVNCFLHPSSALFSAIQWTEHIVNSVVSGPRKGKVLFLINDFALLKNWWDMITFVNFKNCKQMVLYDPDRYFREIDSLASYKPGAIICVTVSAVECTFWYCMWFTVELVYCNLCTSHFLPRTQSWCSSLRTTLASHSLLHKKHIMLKVLPPKPQICTV